MTVQEVSKAIDKLHASSVKAINQKDVPGYMSIFSDDLIYTQYSGKVVDKATLTKDQEAYFSRIESVESSYERVASESDSNIYSETLIQKARISTRVFVFFKKRWNIKRKGVYTWSYDNNEWKIVSVKVLEEEIN